MVHLQPTTPAPTMSFQRSMSIPSTCTMLLGLVVAFLGVVQVRAELKPRCGDCWCIFDGELDECPADQSGIADTFPAEEFKIYETFTLTNPEAPYLQLRTADGEECYPFANTLGPLENYPKSSLPQCAYPESTEETVCAFLYEEGQACQSRNYQALTFDTVAEAEAAGAVVTHKKACGVCSNAYDLWGRMASIDDFETDTLICGVSYLLNPDKDTRFDSLVQCAQKAGLSAECSLLWAHYGAATVSECSDSCNAGTGSETNGPAPECALTPCPACSTAWNENFAKLSGRTLEGSGINEGTAKACSSFARIEHDPCVGAPTSGSDLAPTPTPASSGGLVQAGTTSSLLFSLLLATFIVVTTTSAS